MIKFKIKKDKVKKIRPGYEMDVIIEIDGANLGKTDVKRINDDYIGLNEMFFLKLTGKNKLLVKGFEIFLGKHMADKGKYLEELQKRVLYIIKKYKKERKAVIKKEKMAKLKAESETNE